MTIPASMLYALSHDSVFLTRLGDGTNSESVRLYESGALGYGDIPEHPEFPWGAWTELPATSHTAVHKASRAKDRTYQFFFYDEAGDYTTINLLLARAEQIIAPMAPFNTTDGFRCYESVWQGLSGNLRDDGYRCFVRFGTARMTVNQ